MQPLSDLINTMDIAHPVTFTVTFLLASWLMIWRLEAILNHGLEGTALGTLIVPYCSGLGNLVFVFILWRSDGPPVEIMVNSLVNNVTNLTLLLALPALIWPLHVVVGKGSRTKLQEQRLSRLALMLTLTAVLFFTGLTWALGRDGVLDRGDGLALIGLFFFWQSFQVFDVQCRRLRVFPGRTLGLDHRMAVGAPQRTAGLLLRLEKTGRHRLQFPNRRWPHLHSALLGTFCRAATCSGSGFFHHRTLSARRGRDRPRHLPADRRSTTPLGRRSPDRGLCGFCV